MEGKILRRSLPGSAEQALRVVLQGLQDRTKNDDADHQLLETSGLGEASGLEPNLQDMGRVLFQLSRIGGVVPEPGSRVQGRSLVGS